MKESAFRVAVLSKLSRSIHRQPMLASGLGTAGTPDTYIDGPKNDLWVEWKVVRSEDFTPSTFSGHQLPTQTQQLWLRRRYENGGNTIVVVGLKLRGRAHGVILITPDEWENPVPRETYEPRIIAAKQIADYIKDRVS